MSVRGIDPGERQLRNSDPVAGTPAAAALQVLNRISTVTAASSERGTLRFIIRLLELPCL